MEGPPRCGCVVIAAKTFEDVEQKARWRRFCAVVTTVKTEACIGVALFGAKGGRDTSDRCGSSIGLGKNNGNNDRCSCATLLRRRWGFQWLLWPRSLCGYRLFLVHVHSSADSWRSPILGVARCQLCFGVVSGMFYTPNLNWVFRNVTGSPTVSPLVSMASETDRLHCSVYY